MSAGGKIQNAGCPSLALGIALYQPEKRGCGTPCERGGEAASTICFAASAGLLADAFAIGSTTSETTKRVQRIRSAKGRGADEQNGRRKSR